MKFDVVIIGGGAAGLFCGIEAGKRGRRVLVIERNSQVGRKIIISGGGRCNFTNTGAGPENFISHNPHFCKSALARYTPGDFVDLVKMHRIEFYEKKLGQLFCRESSKPIVKMLLDECARKRVEIYTSCTVSQIERSANFVLTTSAGSIECERLVIATGGLSFPKVGATDFGYSIAKQFGLKVEPTRPSLVALIFDASHDLTKLAGVSVDSLVAAGPHTFRENVLFTHRGLSGPAILQVSNYWKRAEAISIDLTPDHSVIDLLEENRGSGITVGRLLTRQLPERLVTTFFDAQLRETPMHQLSKRRAIDVAGLLNSWPVRFRDTEGYDKAEVTLGGVSTAELSSQTMEAKKVPGLFFIGEVVDVTGWLGGYNFQWAWASAYAAGQVV